MVPQRSPFGHWQENNLTDPTFISHITCLIWLDGHQKPGSEIGSQGQPSTTVRFSLESHGKTFRLKVNTLFHYATLLKSDLNARFFHSHKKQKCLETRAELAFPRTYVENQATLEPILLYRASKCKQNKKQGSEDCLWTHIFTFSSDYCQFFFFFMSRCKQNRIKQFVKETQINTV